jgi:hypothetical protein
MSQRTPPKTRWFGPTFRPIFQGLSYSLTKRVPEKLDENWRNVEKKYIFNAEIAEKIVIFLFF